MRGTRGASRTGPGGHTGDVGLPPARGAAPWAREDRSSPRLGGLTAECAGAPGCRTAGGDARGVEAGEDPKGAQPGCRSSDVELLDDPRLCHPRRRRDGRPATFARLAWAEPRTVPLHPERGGLAHPFCVKDRAREGRNGAAGSSAAEEPGPQGDARRSLPDLLDHEPALGQRPQQLSFRPRLVQPRRPIRALQDDHLPVVDRHHTRTRFGR